MSKKPHKIKHQYSDILPILDSPTFNQTIIINSPSFNIRVVGDRKKQPQQKTPQNRTLTNINTMKQTLSGFDSWMFNENLKQFGQTRRGAMFQEGSRKTQKNFQQELGTKRKDLAMVHRASPYAPDSSTMTKVKPVRQAQTLDVRKRKFVIKDSQTQRMTPEYPSQRRCFRASKFTEVNTTPMNKQYHSKKEQIQSSQQVVIDNEKSISDIDKSIQNVVDKYFDDHNKPTSPHDIQSYVGTVRQPRNRPKQPQFISEISPAAKHCLDMDFKFEQQNEQRRPRRTRTPTRNFKINRQSKSKPKVHPQQS